MYHEQARYPEALQFFRRAQALDSTHTGAQVGIGNILFKRGELDQAAQAYQRVAQGCADCADAHRGLGAVYLRQRRFAEARQAYQQALLSEPNHAPRTTISARPSAKKVRIKRRRRRWNRPLPATLNTF